MRRCAAGYNLMWPLRAIARRGIKPAFLRLLRWWLWGGNSAPTTVPTAWRPSWPSAVGGAVA